MYSLPSFGRTKRHWLAANLTIAVTRGGLLKVAGWSFVATVVCAEAWAIGGVFALFLLGATSTKDFSDMEGDRAHGCITLPVRFGVRRAAWIIAPFSSSVAPDPDSRAPAGSLGHGRRAPDRQPDAADRARARPGGLGAYAARLLLRNPDELASTENHPPGRTCTCS